MAQMTQETNTITPAAWAGDFLNREHLVPGGAQVDASQFLATDGVIVTANGNAAAAATSITVLALDNAIPNGTLLWFGAGKFARLTAAAAAGATTLTVEALVAQVDDTDQATYAGVGKKTIASGTVIGRTFTERGNGDAFGPAAAADDEVYIVAFDVYDADRNPEVTLYRHGSIVKENLLPDWSSLAAAVQTLVRSNYTTTIGIV